jgi:hypothetical protein
LKFEQFATPRLIGFVFLLWLVLAAIGFVVFSVYVFIVLPAIQAIISIVLQAIFLLISAVLVRVFLEAFLVIFRIAEHLSSLQLLGHLKGIAEAKQSK